MSLTGYLHLQGNAFAKSFQIFENKNIFRRLFVLQSPSFGFLRTVFAFLSRIFHLCLFSSTTIFPPESRTLHRLKDWIVSFVWSLTKGGKLRWDEADRRKALGWTLFAQNVRLFFGSKGCSFKVHNVWEWQSKTGNQSFLIWRKVLSLRWFHVTSSELVTKTNLWVSTNLRNTDAKA